MQDDLALTAKIAKTDEFHLGGECTALLAMPASVHELARSPGGANLFGSAYGGGTFGCKVKPDQRIVVTDVATQSVDPVISTGARLAPYLQKFALNGSLWVTAELDKAVVTIDPVQGCVVTSIQPGTATHGLDVDWNDQFVYLAYKGATALGILGLHAGQVVQQLDVSGGCEGPTVSDDRRWFFVASHETRRCTWWLSSQTAGFGLLPFAQVPTGDARLAECGPPWTTGRC